MGDTEVFYKNGFSAVIFSTVMERSVVGNIFRINEERRSLPSIRSWFHQIYFCYICLVVSSLLLGIKALLILS